MKRVHILFFVTITLSSIIMVAGILTRDQTKYHNDFIRIFPPHFATVISSMRVKQGRFSIAGIANNRIFLQDHSSRNGLISTKMDLSDSVHIPIRVPAGTEVMLDSPYFFLHDGYNAILQRGLIMNWSIDTTFTSQGYTAVQPISQNSFILRTVDRSKMKSVFVRSGTPGSNRDILEKQVDGIFCTDGFLRYSKMHHLLVYIYRYRNQFLCFDTLLNLQLAGKTIDTTSVANISVSEVNGEVKMSKPPFVVNKGACIFDRYLFINSNLTARNESVEISKENSVIDVYDIVDGNYIESFYVENFGGYKLQAFLVLKNSLIAMFPGYVVRYSLESKYLAL